MTRHWRSCITLVTALIVLDCRAGAAGWDAGWSAYERGDYQSAMRELLPVADEGHPEAQFLVGVMYYADQGPLQNYPEARRWLRRAAAQCYTAANFLLGEMHRFGLGAPRDFLEASRSYRRAAEAGIPEAEHALGVMLYDGQGVPQDYTEAAKWLHRAAEKGYGRAQFLLSRLYFEGHGVPRDHVLAYRWANLAAARLPQGEERDAVVKIRDALAAEMPPAQLARAQAATREWQPELGPEEVKLWDGSNCLLIGVIPPGNTRSPAEWTSKLAEEFVAGIQADLAALGFELGPIDGVLGPNTRAAIRAFQAGAGLAVDSRVSEALIEALRGAVSMRNRAAAQ